jgi:hypothetical protein
MHSRPPSALIRAHKSDWSTFIGGIELWRLSTSSSKLKWIHGHPEAEPETINSRIGFPSFHLRVLPNLTPDRPGARLAYLTFLIQPFRVHSRRASKRTESGREKKANWAHAWDQDASQNQNQASKPIGIASTRTGDTRDETRVRYPFKQKIDNMTFPLPNTVEPT